MSDLKDMFLFDGLSEDAFAEISKLIPAERCFKKDETIYSAESFFNAIGFIVSGTATAVTAGGGIVMKRFSEGMSFGAAAVFGEGDRYVSTVTAESECVIRFIPETVLRHIVQKYPQTAVNYITFLSGKIRFLNKKLSVVSCGSTQDSVYLYLLNAADSVGNVRLPESMTVLAKMLGIGRASLYRSLDSLESSGRITRENNIIKVKIYEKNS